MNNNRRSGVGMGLMLILIGLILVAFQLDPFQQLFSGPERWPLTIIFLGVIFILFGLVTRASGLAVPGSILTGIGGILYYNANYHAYAEWSYLWTLIPGFVGVGVFLSHLFDLKPIKGLKEGLPSILVSGVLFGIFGSMFNAPILFLEYWPFILIALGIWTLISTMIGSAQDKRKEKVRMERREERREERSLRKEERPSEQASKIEVVVDEPAPAAPEPIVEENVEEEFPTVPEELPDSDTEANPFEEDDEDMPNPL